MIKCLLLYSGGLDSLLVKKILEFQNIKVIPIKFGSCFFDGEIDISEDHLEVMKNPKYGRGKGMNPCRDCHLLMLKKAKAIMEKEKLDFIATGEVVSQRSFSQSKEQLLFLEKQAGLEGLILRPLSANLLPKTIPEEKGWVKDLFGISGKNRKPQMELAEKLGIKNYPLPAGGCILTDKEYSKKLKNLFEIKEANTNDCLVIKNGRVVFEESGFYVITRNEQEGKVIGQFKQEKDILLEPINFAGPSVLIRGGNIQKGKELLLKYSKKIPEDYKINEF